MFTSTFWRDPVLSYLKIYVKYVDPILVLTFSDNFSGFYRLSSVVDSIKTMIIQNGTRGAFLDVFDELVPQKDFRVDYICVFGADIGDMYTRYINGDAYVVGSTRNNFYPISTGVKNTEVLYISQYVDSPGDTKILGNVFGQSITFWDYLHFDSEVLQLTNSWCKRNNRKLTILPRNFDFCQSEYEYFAMQLSDSNWSYAIKNDEKSTYEIIDQSEIVVTVDSTLGYEALARGAKTAFISSRSWNKFTIPFGWPSNLPRNGPFWSDSLNPLKFDSILDHLASIEKLCWTSLIDSEKVIILDTGNTRLVNLIRELQQKSKNQE